MADIKLFNIKGPVQELQSGTVNLEKELQTVIERNMKIFFEITFLASDITETKLKLYTAFKKMKNIICVELSPSKITLYLKLPVDSISYETGFSRDASNVGHWGTGDVELTIKESADFQKAKSLIERAYSEN